MVAVTASPLLAPATGCADSRPVGSNEFEETRALNRRVEIVILNDPSALLSRKSVVEASPEPAAAPPLEATLGAGP